MREYVHVFALHPKRRIADADMVNGQNMFCGPHNILELDILPRQLLSRHWKLVRELVPPGVCVCVRREGG